MVNEAELARAHADPRFKQVLLARSLEQLLDTLYRNQHLASEPAGAQSLRDGARDGGPPCRPDPGDRRPAVRQDGGAIAVRGAFAGCAATKSAYKAPSPLDPGRELNGRPALLGPVGLHGPASRVPAFLRTFAAFPKGTKGLAPDERMARERHKHAIVRTRLPGAPGFEHAAGRGNDQRLQGGDRR